HSADAVVVLVCAVELELEAAEQVEDHDAQAVVQNPGAHTGQVLPPRLQLQQQAVKSSVYLLCLRTHTHTHTHFTQLHTYTLYTATHTHTLHSCTHTLYTHPQPHTHYTHRYKQPH